MKDSSFFEKFRWLDLGKPIFSVFYLGILSIFFIVIISIMSRILFSLKNEKTNTYDMYPELKQESNNNEFVITNADKDVDNVFFEKMQENINIDNKIAEEASYRDKIDTIYKNISEILEDVVNASSISDLFEKTLFCALIASNSKKGSIMAVDKNRELYIFKTSGWDSVKERKFKNIKIPIGNNISGKAASENKKIYIKNVDQCNDFYFNYKNEYESKSLVILPIYGHNRVIAVLNLTDNKNGNYCKGELEILNLITSLSSKIFELIQIRKKNRYMN